MMVIRGITNKTVMTQQKTGGMIPIMKNLKIMTLNDLMIIMIQMKSTWIKKKFLKEIILEEINKVWQEAYQVVTIQNLIDYWRLFAPHICPKVSAMDVAKKTGIQMMK